jgi:hypothetical protein
MAGARGAVGGLDPLTSVAEATSPAVTSEIVIARIRRGVTQAKCLCGM